MALSPGRLLVTVRQDVIFYPTLNITLQSIKPELLSYTNITPVLALQSCPPSAANTMLGICYTCVVLCCSAHGCCAMECGVACCTAQHTAIATLTLPHTRLVAHQSTEKLQPNTLINSLTLGGLAEHQGMPKE